MTNLEITKNTIYSFFHKTPYFKYVGWDDDYGDMYYYEIDKSKFTISYLKTGEDFFEVKIEKLFNTKQGGKFQTILTIKDDYFMLINLLKQIQKKLLNNLDITK